MLIIAIVSYYFTFIKQPTTGNDKSLFFAIHHYVSHHQLTCYKLVSETTELRR